MSFTDRTLAQNPVLSEHIYIYLDGRVGRHESGAMNVDLRLVLLMVVVMRRRTVHVMMVAARGDWCRRRRRRRRRPHLVVIGRRRYGAGCRRSETAGADHHSVRRTAAAVMLSLGLTRLEIHRRRLGVYTKSSRRFYATSNFCDCHHAPPHTRALPLCVDVITIDYWTYLRHARRLCFHFSLFSLLVSRTKKKLLKSNFHSVARGPWKGPLDFSGNPDQVTLRLR